VELTGTALHPGSATGILFFLRKPVSFWGGVDPLKGIVADPRHPQYGAPLSGRILVMERTIGSSSSSAIMLELLRNGRTPILRTDVQGARTLKANLENPLLVFVTAPSVESLERRIRSRAAETEAEIVARLAEAEAELAEADWFDLVIINRDGSHDDAAEQLVKAISSARARRHRAP